MYNQRFFINSFHHIRKVQAQAFNNQQGTLFYQFYLLIENLGILLSKNNIRNCPPLALLLFPFIVYFLFYSEKCWSSIYSDWGSNEHHYASLHIIKSKGRKESIGHIGRRIRKDTYCFLFFPLVLYEFSLQSCFSIFFLFLKSKKVRKALLSPATCIISYLNYSSLSESGIFSSLIIRSRTRITSLRRDRQIDTLLYSFLLLYHSRVVCRQPKERYLLFCLLNWLSMFRSSCLSKYF